jgi:hypothetical protein
VVSFPGFFGNVTECNKGPKGPKGLKGQKGTNEAGPSCFLSSFGSFRSFKSFVLSSLYTRTLPGPAAFTSSLTPDSYFLKFSANMSASWEALVS